MGSECDVLPSAAVSSNQIAKQSSSDPPSSDATKPFAAHHIHYPSRPTLHWTPHAKKKSGGFMKKRSEAPQSLTLKDLHGAHWAGRIPKVACIMAVPSTTRAHARLKYVVNNFRSQNYEGPKQLIIVYHHQDHRGAARIQKLADGHLVKAVGARTMEA